MDETLQKQIFSHNLRYYVENSGKQQKEIAKDLGISYTTFNTWANGRALPNAAKIQTIADYFHIGKSALLDERSSDTGEEASEIGREVIENPSLLNLFHEAEKSDEQGIEMATDLLKKMNAYREGHNGKG